MDMLTIMPERLKRDLNELAAIGLKRGGEGIYRLAFTPEEEVARNWLIGKGREAGLAVRTDGARNIFVRLGAAHDAPAVATGSHLDPVPGGARLDGALGVVCGLECLRRLKELDVSLNHPLELIAFTDEEARFGSMIGSGALCGLHTMKSLRALKDDYGLHLKNALETYNTSCQAVLASARSVSEYRCFVELHIEQGPVLHEEGITCGIVTGIVGLFRWRARLKGAANHAGTTPMHLRRDALAGLVRFASGIDEVLEAHGSDQSRATIGKVETHPGAVAVIPGEVKFTLDVRDTQSQVLQRLQREFERRIGEAARQCSLELELETSAGLKPVSCDESLIDAIEQTAGELGISHRRMPSGAGHDAATMASITPIAMIFIPSIDGISHSPAEASEWTDIEKGANLLLNTLTRLGQMS